MEGSKTRTGKIKVVKPSPQCFGFLIADDGSGELFFHKSRCELFEELQVGDTVRYRIGEGRRGPAAISIRRVSSDLSGDSAGGTADAVKPASK